MGKKSQGKIWQEKRGSFFRKNQGKLPPDNPDPAGGGCFLWRYRFYPVGLPSENGIDHDFFGSRTCRSTGGVRVNVVKDAVKAGADILVVGCAITASKDTRHAADEFQEPLDREEIDQFSVMTDL